MLPPIICRHLLYPFSHAEPYQTLLCKKNALFLLLTSSLKFLPLYIVAEENCGVPPFSVTTCVVTYYGNKYYHITTNCYHNLVKNKPGQLSPSAQGMIFGQFWGVLQILFGMVKTIAHL